MGVASTTPRQPPRPPPPTPLVPLYVRGLIDICSNLVDSDVPSQSSYLSN